MVFAVGMALWLGAQDHAWGFDGEAGAHARVLGRAEYRDSAVAGTALVLNGVDTRVELTPPSAPEKLALWFYACEPVDAALVDGGGMTIRLKKDGSLVGPGGSTRPGQVYPGQWTHVALARGRLFVNGEPAAAVVRPGLPATALVLGAPPFRGLIDEVRAGDGMDPAALAAALPWYRPRPHRHTPFPEGKFVLEPGDTVALLGGENMVGLGDAGHLETTLLMAGPKDLRLRSLAWEGDTVFEQRRDLNFGPWSRYLERSGATVLFVQFGAMEALRGGGDFRASYGRLIDQLQERTKRIVILSPTRFEKKSPPLPDLSARNGDLARIVEACREIATERKLPFVDLSGLELSTRDGAHLTDEGQKAVAREVARQLGLDEPPTETTAVAALREAVREKNRLWFDHWRPMNWAFLEGDRTEQPSSRDHTDRALRWFPVEMQDFLPLIRRAEARIEEAKPR